MQYSLFLSPENESSQKESESKVRIANELKYVTYLVLVSLCHCVNSEDPPM